MSEEAQELEFFSNLHSVDANGNPTPENIADHALLTASALSFGSSLAAATQIYNSVIAANGNTANISDISVTFTNGTASYKLPKYYYINGVRGEFQDDASSSVDIDANQGGIQTWGNNGVDGIKTEPPFEFEVDYRVYSYDGLITGVSKPWASPNGGHWVDEHGIGVTASVFGLYWKRGPVVDVPVSPALIGGYVQYTYSNGSPSVTTPFYESVIVSP